MAEVARCLACGHEFLYPPAAAGRMGTCSRCRQAVLLGAPPGKVEGANTEGGTRMGYGPPPNIAPRPAVPPPVPAIRSGVVLGGRYEIAEELGRGAFGVVYRALDIRLERKPVAVKVLLEKALATPDAVRRFRAEARLLCQVHHAQVPAVLDLGEYAGQQYIVFAFVNGKTVRELIPPGGFDDPAVAVRLVAKLARTLHDIYAGQGILHRDVKPANMMVPTGQADGLYLMDFGLAVCHDTDETRTQEGTMMGTLWYMAPEQAEGRISEIGHRADLYSAAAVLYHLLTGRPPFDSKWPAIVADILLSPPEPPSAFRADLDPDLDAIVLRGLNKRPEDRYATGAEFAEVLELWAARALLSGKVGPRSHGASSHTTGSQNRSGGHVPVKRPDRARPSESETSAVADSTVNEPPGRGGAQVVFVKALPSEKSRGLKIALAALAGALFLIICVYALAKITGTKSEPTAPSQPAPDSNMKPWQRG